MLAMLAALALAQANPAGPPDPQPMDGVWRVGALDGESNMGKIAMFVEPASIVRDGQRVTFRTDFRAQQSSVNADSVVMIVRADCASYRHQILQAGFYRERRLLRALDALPEETAAEGTNIHALIGNVCSGQYMSEAVDRVDFTRQFFAAQ
jgi:hypothetical protein